MNVNHGGTQSDSQGILFTQAEHDTCIRAQLPLTRSDSGVASILRTAADEGIRIGVACSGGADSVLLLRWLLAHFPECRAHLHVIHFDHATREGQSEEDGRFVHALSQTLCLKLIAGKRESHRGELLNENTLRHHRMRFFRVAMQQHQIPLLLTGHHLSDRVESLLMRLSRGSSLEGLIAPLPVQEFRDGLRFLRPLLKISKSDIASILTRIGQDWREDASNHDLKHYRNFIRHALMPLWAQHSPHPIERNIGRSLTSLTEDAEALDYWLQEVLVGVDLNARQCVLAPVNAYPIALRRRFIWRWLNQHGQGSGLSGSVIDALLIAKPGQRWTLPSSWKIHAASAGVLTLIPPGGNTPPFKWGALQYYLEEGSHLLLPGHWILTASWLPTTPEMLESIQQGHDDPSNQVHLDASRCHADQRIQVSFRITGMRYQPLGCSYDRTLKKCMIDQKIPQFERDRLPVIQNNKGELIWVPGLPPSESGRVTATTKQLLRLTYRKTFPSFTV